MTETIMTTLLVGAYHRKPAKQVLSAVPAGLPLILQPEWDNPYDPLAVKVWLQWQDVPERFDEKITAALQGTGIELSDLREAPRDDDLPPAIHLGYLAKTGGKPLAGSTYPGNAEILKILGVENAADWAGKPIGRLAFNNKGEPLIHISCPQAQAQE